MKREVMNEWLAALRSGDYEQGSAFLCKNDKFCCLGVFLDVVKEPYKINQSNTRHYGFEVSGLPYNVVQEYKFYSHLGFNIEENERSLYFLNDMEKLSFNQIADIIEANPTDYFELED